MQKVLIKKEGKKKQIEIPTISSLGLGIVLMYPT